MELNEPEMSVLNMPVIVIPNPKPLVQKPEKNDKNDKKVETNTRVSLYFKNYFNLS